MRRAPVSSSVLASVGYDPGSATLEIRFRSGALYRFFDVPPEVVLDLLEAPSLGHAFTTSIRDSYRYERLR